MFTTEIKVIEIRESGARVTHYLKGKKKDVMKDVEAFKIKSKSYEMIGKRGMIVWV